MGNLTKPFGQDPQFLKQLAWPDFMNDSIHSDAWCQDGNNNRPPLACIPAHSSPITLRFYKSEDGCSNTNRSFSCSQQGDAFISLHGSWNRPIPVGYSVVRIPFDKLTNLPSQKLEYIFSVKDYQTQCQNSGNANYNCFRPSGLAFKDGLLYVSSDSTGDIVRVLVGSPDAVLRDPLGNSSVSKCGCLGLFLILFFWVLFI